MDISDYKILLDSFESPTSQDEYHRLIENFGPRLTSVSRHPFTQSWGVLNQCVNCGKYTSNESLCDKCERLVKACYGSS